MRRPRLYVVALSHLDTQWRWTVRDTVERFLPRTVEANEALFERFPHYVLSFEGSERYELLAEHYPTHFARVRQRVANGQWHPAGAALEAFDTLVPSPESIVRQILHGRRWFRRELQRDSRDLFLPDCFGFPATLPTIARHLGLIGFSTQKLRRGELMRSAFGIPFAFGVWRGRDGSELLAALDPGEYSGRVTGDLTSDPHQLDQMQQLAAAGVPPLRLLYIGVGDRGGALPAESVELLAAALAADGPIEVLHGPSDQIFAETDAADLALLPRYEGELLLRVHGTGCYTAKALLKRWNRRVEQLARIAETAAAAALAAGSPAPRSRFTAAWRLLLAHQMHDDLTGTAIPSAYRYSLADLGLAANEFREIALDAVAAAGFTESTGAANRALAIVAVTTLAQPSEEVVELTGVPSGAVAVEDADGVRRALQHLPDTAQATRRALVRWSARGAGLERLRLSFDPADAANLPSVPATASAHRLENGRYAVEFGADGALRSLVDKALGRQLLAAPAALELLPDRSAKYPAWEILWSDASAAPLGFVEASPRLEVVESGPLRVALRVVRRAPGVEVRETWMLAAEGAGEMLVAEVEIAWRRRARLLKARFPLAAVNDHALYDTGLGAIARPIASEALYEVPAQHWAAIEDRAGGFGVALFADARHGWDQPDGRTLRSTWIHAPRASFKWRHQATQDFGRHHFRFGIAGFAAGGVADGSVAALADRFVHRPALFWFDGGDSRPRRQTLLGCAGPARLLALKPAEEDDRLVVRLSNPTARAVPLELTTVSPELSQLMPCDGMEAPVSGDGDDSLPIPPGGLATLRGHRLPRRVERQISAGQPLTLPWSGRSATANSEAAPGAGFDGRGRFLPLELLPERLDEAAIVFDLAAERRHRGDHLVASGQQIELPAGSAELWLLAASIRGDREVRFEIDGRACSILVPDWRAPLLEERSRQTLALPFAAVRRAEFRRRPTVWSCGHLHDRHGRDLPVTRAMLFALRLAVAGAASVRLPVCPALRVVAATVTAVTARPLREAQPSDPA